MKLWQLAIICAVLITGVGALIGSLVPTDSYDSQQQPSIAPPSWVFGPVWTVLYILMGVSVALLISAGARKALIAFGAQLALNYAWTPIFFGLEMQALALVVIIALLLAIVATMKYAYSQSRLATYLLIPYLLWVAFATILNASYVF